MLYTTTIFVQDKDTPEKVKAELDKILEDYYLSNDSYFHFSLSGNEDEYPELVEHLRSLGAEDSVLISFSW